MSDAIKHECGIALLRLRKPLEYYQEKYGSSFYALNKMYLLMEKQHNRGQDGAGLANIKFDMPPGKRFISRTRSIASAPIKEIFEGVQQRIAQATEKDPGLQDNPQALKDALPFTGELFLGHLRYGTYGKNTIEACHPFLRQNNWMTRNLILAGNFNMTNVDQLFEELVGYGQHPKEKADTVTILEKIGHFTDEENDRLYEKFKAEGLSKPEISKAIARDLNVKEILMKSAKSWDGGYAMAGLFGHGDSFVLRDPSGIRPAYYFANDEVIVVASERPAIQTAFNAPFNAISEIKPGHALIIDRDGSYVEEQILEPRSYNACSFERIYFSRGSDTEIYKERKALGAELVPAIMEAIDHDLENTVLSYIPNTAETAFMGVVEGMDNHLRAFKLATIQNNPPADEEGLKALLALRPRVEKIAIKDAKLRTFITQDSSRDDLVAHVYDVTYGVVRSTDYLVVVDDSIVRGTTLRQSILRMLDRLQPKTIVVASSAPQIRYPDCYGIDMARMGDFIAFQAAISLLKERDMEQVIENTYKACMADLQKPLEESKNQVKAIYAPFSAQEISDRIAQLLTPKEIKAQVKVLYQGLDALHRSCPNNPGDWYFSGDYPTPGGHRVVNKAFVNYVEGRAERAY